MCKTAPAAKLDASVVRVSGSVGSGYDSVCTFAREDLDFSKERSVSSFQIIGAYLGPVAKADKGEAMPDKFGMKR